MRGRHYLVIPLGASGFYAICSCGWKSEPRPDKKQATTDGADHLKQQIAEKRQQT